MAEENTASENNSSNEKEDDKISEIIQSWNKLPGCVGEELWEKTKKLFNETALLILGIGWPNVPIVAKSKLTLVLHMCVQEAGQSCAKSKALMDALSDLMLNPWGNSYLLEILNSNYDSVEKIALYECFCKTENPAVTWLRLKTLEENNCQDLALKLCTCCLHRSTFHDEQKLNDMHVRLLFNQGHLEEIINKLSRYSCHDGLEMIKRIQTDQDDFTISLAEFLTRMFLVKDMINVSEYCCTQKLMTAWIDLLLLRQIDLTVIHQDVLNLCTLSMTSAHFYLMADILYDKFGNELLRLYVELYIRALTVDINFLENIRLTNNAEATLEMEVHVANTLCKLAFLLDKYPKLARECLLTAFSIDPSKERLARLEMFAEKPAESWVTSPQTLLPIVPCSGECHCQKKGECRRLLKEAGIKLEEVKSSEFIVTKDDDTVNINTDSSYVPVVAERVTNAEETSNDDIKSESDSENIDDSICMEAENLLITSLYSNNNKDILDDKSPTISEQETQPLEADGSNGASHDGSKLPSFMLFAESPVTTATNPVGQWNVPLYNSSPSLSTSTIQQPTWFSVENNYISKIHNSSQNANFMPASNDRSLLLTSAMDKIIQLEDIFQIQSHVLDAEVEGVDQRMLKDLSIVLDEPRNKVLSWDLDWDELKQRCQLYLETKSAFKSIIEAQLFSGKSPPIFYIKHSVNSPLKHPANIDIAYHTEGDDSEVEPCTVNTITLKKLFPDQETKNDELVPPLESSALSEHSIKEKITSLGSVNVRTDNFDIASIKNMNPTVVISHSDIVDAEKQLFVKSATSIKLKNASRENTSLAKDIVLNTNVTQKMEKESPVFRNVLLGNVTNEIANIQKESVKSNPSSNKAYSNGSHSNSLPSTTMSSFSKDSAKSQALISMNVLTEVPVTVEGKQIIASMKEMSFVRHLSGPSVTFDNQTSSKHCDKTYIESNQGHGQFRQDEINASVTSYMNCETNVSLESLEDINSIKQKNLKDPVKVTLVKSQDLLAFSANQSKPNNFMPAHVVIKSLSQLPVAFKVQSLVSSADNCFAKHLRKHQTVFDNSEINVPTTQTGTFISEGTSFHSDGNGLNPSATSQQSILSQGQLKTNNQIKVSQALRRPITSVPSISQLTGTSNNSASNQILFAVEDNQNTSPDALPKQNEENHENLPTLLYTDDGSNVILCSSVFSDQQFVIDATDAVKNNCETECSVDSGWNLQNQNESNGSTVQGDSSKNHVSSNNYIMQEQISVPNGGANTTHTTNTNGNSQVSFLDGEELPSDLVNSLKAKQACLIKIVDFNHNSNQVDVNNEFFQMREQDVVAELSSSQNYVGVENTVFSNTNADANESLQLLYSNVENQIKDSSMQNMTLSIHPNPQDFEANYKQFLLNSFKQKKQNVPEITQSPTCSVTSNSNSLPSKSDSPKSAPPPRVSSAPLPQRANSPMLQALIENGSRLFEVVDSTTSSNRKHKTLFSNKNDKKWISVRNQHGIMEYKKAQCKQSSKYNFFNIQSPLINSTSINSLQGSKRKTHVTTINTLKTKIAVPTSTASTLIPTSVANSTISPPKTTVTNAGSVCAPVLTTSHSQMTSFVQKTGITNPITVPTSTTHLLQTMKHISPLQQNLSPPSFVSSSPQIVSEAALSKECVSLTTSLQTSMEMAENEETKLAQVSKKRKKRGGQGAVGPCGYCDKGIYGKSKRLICNGECKKKFHLQCTTVALDKAEEVAESWLCTHCESKNRHQLENEKATKTVNTQVEDHSIDDDLNLNLPNPSDIKCEIPNKLFDNASSDSACMNLIEVKQQQKNRTVSTCNSTKKSSKKKKAPKNDSPKSTSDYVMKVSQIIQSIQQEQKLSEVKVTPEKKKKSDSPSKTKSPSKKEPKPKEEKSPSSGSNKPECTLCRKNFCSMFSLRRHMQKIHKVVENGAGQSNKTDEQCSAPVQNSNVTEFPQRSLDVSFQSVKSDDDKGSIDDQPSNFYFETNITDACPLDKATVDYNDSLCTEQNQNENYETLSNHFNLFSDPEPEENYLDKFNYEKNSFGTISASAYNLFSDPEAEENPLESSLDDESVFISTMDERLIIPSYLERSEEVERIEVDKCESVPDEINQTLDEEIVSITDKNLTSRTKDWARDDTSTEGSVDSTSFTKGRTRSRVSKVTNKRCCPCCESSDNEVAKKCRKDSRGNKQPRSPSKKSKDSKRAISQQDSLRTRNLHKR